MWSSPQTAVGSEPAFASCWCALCENLHAYFEVYVSFGHVDSLWCGHLLFARAQRLGARGSESRFLACCLTGWDAADHFCELFGGLALSPAAPAEAVVNRNGLWCTQKASGGERWVRRRPSAHPRGGWRWLLWTKQASGAHGRRQDEAVVNENSVLCTQEALGGESWVRRGSPAHTGAREVVEMGAEKALSAHGSARSGGVVDNFCYLCGLQDQLWSISIIFFRRIGCVRWGRMWIISMDW